MGRRRGFWIEAAGMALLVALPVGLDGVLIAAGQVSASHGLAVLPALPLVAGVIQGLAHRRARLSEHGEVAFAAAAALYAALIGVAVVGLALSSPISCSQPNAPSNCDNDIGTAVGLLLGLLLAGITWGLMYCGSVVGTLVARVARAGRDN